MIPIIDLKDVLTVAAPIVVSLLNKANGEEKSSSLPTTNMIENKQKEVTPISNNYYINIFNNYYMTPDDRIHDTPNEISRKALEVLSSDSHYDI